MQLIFLAQMFIVEVVELCRGSAVRAETGGAGIGGSGGGVQGVWLDRRGVVEEDVAELVLRPSQGDLDGRVGPVATLLLVFGERRRPATTVTIEFHPRPALLQISFSLSLTSSKAVESH